MVDMEPNGSISVQSDTGLMLDLSETVGERPLQSTSPVSTASRASASASPSVASPMRRNWGRAMTRVIREAGHGDVDAICAIGERTWPPTYAFAGPEYVADGIRRWWSPDVVRQGIDEHMTLVASLDDVVVGMALLHDHDASRHLEALGASRASWQRRRPRPDGGDVRASRPCRGCCPPLMHRRQRTRSALLRTSWLHRGRARGVADRRVAGRSVDGTPTRPSASG